MRNKFLLIPLSVMLAGMIMLAAGCWGQKAKAEISATTAKATPWYGPASATTANNLRLFVVAGAILAVAGGVGGFLFRSPVLAASLGGTGIALGAAVTLFTEYPWVLLVASLGGMLVLAAHVIFNMRTIERKTEVETALAMAVETAPGGQSVKARLIEMGQDIAAKVKSVISPIKAKMTRPKEPASPNIEGAETPILLNESKKGKTKKAA